MIAKKISFLAITLLWLPTINFAAENKQDRYNSIKSWFLSPTNQSTIGFTAQKNDIIIVTEHKTNLEKERDSYKNSWVPLFLKLIGTGLAVDAITMATYGISAALAPFYWKPLHNALAHTDRAIYPISYMRNKITGPIAHPIEDKLLEMELKEGISWTTRKIGLSAINLSISLFSAAISASLFNQANSYQKKIRQLQEAIAVDEKMLSALENPPTDQAE
jgi:hypothetical protein